MTTGQFELAWGGELNYFNKVTGRFGVWGRVLLGAGCLLLAPGCGASAGGERVPPETVPSFPTAEADERGFDAEHLAASVAELPSGHGLDGVLVVRDGDLVFERYFEPFDRDMLHDLRSATKSITSLLMGTLIDRGEIEGTEEKMADYLRPDYQVRAELDAIRLEDLLTMRSGLDCDDSDPDTLGQEDRLYSTKDWIATYLELKLVDAPGKRTRYCTGNVIALGRVAERASGLGFQSLAKARLFDPLGIEHFRFETFDEGRGTDSGGHLHLRPRDLAKVGELVLGGGEFRGQRVLGREWVERAIARHTDFGEPHTDYGYLFWSDEIEALGAKRRVVYASGNGGQALFLVPELRLIAVTVAHNYNSPRAQLSFQWFAQGVMGALRN